jgi:hypothetical protein
MFYRKVQDCAVLFVSRLIYLWLELFGEWAEAKRLQCLMAFWAGISERNTVLRVV